MVTVTVAVEMDNLRFQLLLAGVEQLTSSTSVFDQLPRSYRLQVQDAPLGTERSCEFFFGDSL